MSLKEDVADLKDHLDEMESLGQLRTHLIQRGLRLILTIYSTGFSCMDWNITERQVTGVLHLGFRIKISKLVKDESLLETRAIIPVYLDEAGWIDQKDLFATLKQGIKIGIKKIAQEIKDDN